MILKSLRIYFLTKTAITDILGTRIQGAPLPQNSPKPAADMRVVTAIPDHALDGLSGPIDTTITIDCYADDQETADELAEAMAYCGIVGYRGILTDEIVNSVRLANGPVQANTNGVEPGTDQHEYVATFTLAITYSRPCR